MTALIKNLTTPLQRCMPANGNRGLSFVLEADCTDLLSKVTAPDGCLVISEPDNDTAIVIPAPSKAFPTTINNEEVDTSKIFLTIPCSTDAPKTLLDSGENLIILR